MQCNDHAEVLLQVDDGWILLKGFSFGLQVTGRTELRQ